jgi:hypothetical protein
LPQLFFSGWIIANVSEHQTIQVTSFKILGGSASDSFDVRKGGIKLKLGDHGFDQGQTGDVIVRINL